MVTFNKVVSDLCEVCGVEHDATSRVTERRGIELIRKCTEKVKVLTMGTAALATVLEDHLDKEEAETLKSEVELVTEEELPKKEEPVEEKPAPRKLGK